MRRWQNVKSWDYKRIKRQLLPPPNACYTELQSGSKNLTFLWESVQPKQSSGQFRQPDKISLSHDSGPVTVRARPGL